MSSMPLDSLPSTSYALQAVVRPWQPCATTSGESQGTEQRPLYPKPGDDAMGLGLGLNMSADSDAGDAKIQGCKIQGR
jgi:hypothetical protein